MKKKQNKTDQKKTNKKDKTNKTNKIINPEEGSILHFLKPKNSLEKIKEKENQNQKENENEKEDYKYKTEIEENSDTQSSNSNKINKIKIPIKFLMPINFNINSLNQNSFSLQQEKFFNSKNQQQKIKREKNEDSKRKIIINENFIEEFLNNFSLFNETIKKKLKFFNENYNYKIFSEKNYNVFNKNLNLFLIKFFLQIEEIFIFVPNFLSNSKMEDIKDKEFEKKKHLFKLLENFDSSDCYLNYQPITKNEVK
jgi:hypothetical protein